MKARIQSSIFETSLVPFNSVENLHGRGSDFNRRVDIQHVGGHFIMTPAQ